MTMSNSLHWFLISLTIVISSSINYDATIVTTQYGPIQGVSHGSVISFTSIPYARPPVGNLRWTMPTSPDPWTETKQCNEDPPRCVQGGRYNISEDCLFVNVFVPKSCISDTSNKCASMMWIHGGSYISGSGGAAEFNGTYMAEQTNVIIVTINYRLGVLGFLWNSELELYGNYGHFDQVFAIEWCYNNIEAFGGDKGQIFIYGESAGATSVSLHVANTSNHIIKGAILESIPAGIPCRMNETWGLMPNQFEDVMGCSKKDYPDGKERLECLRNVTFYERILIAQDEAIGVSTARYPYLFWPDFMPWTPTVDEHGLIKKQPQNAWMEGDILDIPLIIGTNENESNIFWDPIPTECFEVSVELDDLFGPRKGAKIRDFYNIPTGFGDCRNISKGFQTDSIFRCLSRNMTMSASIKNNGHNVYWYHFNHVPSYGDDVHCAQPNGGVCHAAEVPFVFGTRNDFTSEEEELSEMMRWYWASFARSGGDVNEYAVKSNNKLLVQWNAYDNEQATMLLDTGRLDVDSPFADDVKYCDFWDNEIGYDWINRL